MTLPTHCLPLLLIRTLLGRGQLRLPLSKFSIYWSGPGWLISNAAVAVPLKGLGEEVEGKPIKAHPAQQGNSTRPVSSSFHTFLVLSTLAVGGWSCGASEGMTQGGMCQSPCKCHCQPLPSAKGQQVSPLTFGVYRCGGAL